MKLDSALPYSDAFEEWHEWSHAFLDSLRSFVIRRRIGQQNICYYYIISDLTFHSTYKIKIQGKINKTDKINA